MTPVMRVQRQAMRTQREWYVTAKQGMYARTTSETVWVPTADIHLKRLGEATTACGLSTLNWQVFWLDEPSTCAGLCTNCVRVLRET